MVPEGMDKRLGGHSQRGDAHGNLPSVYESVTKENVQHIRLPQNEVHPPTRSQDLFSDLQGTQAAAQLVRRSRAHHCQGAEEGLVGMTGVRRKGQKSEKEIERDRSETRQHWRADYQGEDEGPFGRSKEGGETESGTGVVLRLPTGASAPIECFVSGKAATLAKPRPRRLFVGGDHAYEVLQHKHAHHHSESSSRDHTPSESTHDVQSKISAEKCC